MPIPSREQCLKWAIDAGLFRSIPLPHVLPIEALCTRVWNEAMEEAARVCEHGVLGHGECADAIRELKHQSNNPATSDISVR